MSGFRRPNRARKSHAGGAPLRRPRFAWLLRASSAPHKGQRQLETTGLIVIAILILAITIFRYWHNINWRSR